MVQRRVLKEIEIMSSIWEQVKGAMVESAREVYGSERVWCNKVVARRKKVVWKECWQLAMKNPKKNVWKLTEKKRERLKGVYIRAKRKKMNSLEGR